MNNTSPNRTVPGAIKRVQQIMSRYMPPRDLRHEEMNLSIPLDEWVGIIAFLGDLSKVVEQLEGKINIDPSLIHEGPNVYDIRLERQRRANNQTERNNA